MKIPKSYLNKWVHVQQSEEEGEPILMNDLDVTNLAILDRQGQAEAKGRVASQQIRHPLAAALFVKVSWHGTLHATEFVYSTSRTYTSTQVSGMELAFETHEGGRVAFGQTIVTEGISIELEPTLAKSVHDGVMEALVKGRNEWVPSLLKALTAYLSTRSGGSGPGVSSFVVRDLVAILSTALEQSGRKWTPEAIAEELQLLSQNQDRLQRLAESYYRTVVSIENLDDESFGSTDHRHGVEKDREELESKIRRLKQAVASLAPTGEGFARYLDFWIYNTLLNSFGLVATNALQRLAGVGESVIGYAPDVEGVGKGKYKVYLYDRDANGSGSSEVGHKFMHILHVQRHGETTESRLLPTDDFLTLLEEELLQCPQHHADISALEMLKQRLERKREVGLPELGYVSEQAREVLSISGLTWERLGVLSRQDGWRLPVLRQKIQELSRSTGIDVDDLIRATTICWTGCPECLLNGESMMGGMLGETLLDKALLDEFFRMGRTKSKMYLEIELKELVEGKADIPFGNLSKVVLDRPNRRIRSVSLPYTVGIDVPRQVDIPPKLIIRTSDIEGLSLFERVSNQPSHGIGTLGFRRLLWHDLVLTAYLDLLGLVPAGRRGIEAVFYDARDIEFQDVGVSPRMLDAIVEYARITGKRASAQVPDRLSDMLIWLANSGFEVALCVDKERLEEQGVASFVKRLIQHGCKVVSKDLSGLMHKKAVATPLGAIEGSANLTRAGTESNEEIISYAPWGTPSFVEIQTSIRDTYHGTRPVYMGD